MKHIKLYEGKIPKDIKTTEEPKFFNHGELIEFVLKTCSDMQYKYDYQNRKLVIYYSKSFMLERVYFVHNLLQVKFNITIKELILKQNINEDKFSDDDLDSDWLEKIEGLKIFRCKNQDVTYIPKMPEGLRQMFVENNGLTEIEKLPQSLEILHCQYNDLEELPVLTPNLEQLDCSNNNLTKLPEIPSSLTQIRLDNDVEIHTIPDYRIRRKGGLEEYLKNAKVIWVEKDEKKDVETDWDLAGPPGEYYDEYDEEM